MSLRVLTKTEVGLINETGQNRLQKTSVNNFRKIVRPEGHMFPELKRLFKDPPL